jgi:F-type H+-transporting ATPase subunit gamma
VHLLVVATSDKGLAGAFNTNIVRLARKKAEELRALARPSNSTRSARRARTNSPVPIVTTSSNSIEPGDLGKLTSQVQGWGEDLTARFEAGEFDVAHLLFSKFVSRPDSGADGHPTDAGRGDRDRQWHVPSVGASVEYEPDEEEILADLLPRNVSVQLLRANRENAASEQGSK